jgi:hypothetical protein
MEVNINLNTRNATCQPVNACRRENIAYKIPKIFISIADHAPALTLTALYLHVPMSNRKSACRPSQREMLNFKHLGRVF